jgi:hypothetical protein
MLDLFLEKVNGFVDLNYSKKRGYPHTDMGAGRGD